MAKVVFGLFYNIDQADQAVDELQAAGYKPEEISIIAGKKYGQVVYEDQGNNVLSNTLKGAAAGGVIGGIAGLLIGVGTISIPGIGVLLIGGPIASALGLTGVAASTVSGATTGILAGGLIGALINLGVPERESRVYERGIREGGILVAVPTRTGRESEAREILEEYGAENVRSVFSNI